MDYDIPVRAAKFCKETGCKNFLLVSSSGANSKSNNFYLKLKGEVEDALKEINLTSTSVFRPSVLLGNRNESRPGERIAQIAMKAISFAFLGSFSKYKPIHASEVARAMLEAAKKEMPGFTIYEYYEVKELGIRN